MVNDEGGMGRSATHPLRLENEAGLVAKYKSVAPLSKPGDLILMDFLTLYQSGRNSAHMPSWLMQLRYLKCAYPVGRKIGCQGSFATGVDIASVLPELNGSKS